METAVFYRDLKSELPIASHGEGVYLFDKNGKRYLDAVGGAAVVAIGHGVTQITDAVARHGNEIPFTYNATFTHPWQEELARSLLSIAPDNMAAVYFVSGGSEANETAIKMARQYFVQRGITSKYKILSRWQSFHGVTIGTLSMSGRASWRAPFSPYLLSSPAVVPPYCYRCPFGLTYPGCKVACADDLERVILQEGPENVAAFLAEPISGTSMTGVTPVSEYYGRIREICNHYDVLFIADEVLTGIARTGAPFAIQHWNIEPDIITCGKALASGYAPLAAVIAGRKVVDAYRAGTGEFTHGFTYNGHPLSCFIGLQVLRYMADHNLWQRPAQIGTYLQERLVDLADRHSIIGNVRGRGLLAGIEFVADRKTRAPLPARSEVTARIVRGALDRGVILIPGTPGINYGQGGDHIQITPPYIITAEQIDDIINVLDETITQVERKHLR
jgi:adenosylmethionine-8-amino-7-oxononanoate aminotransferase